jgi:hypothetical protein
MPIVRFVFSAAPKSSSAAVGPGASVAAGRVAVVAVVVAFELSVSLPHELAKSSTAINDTIHFLVFISLPRSS